MEQSSHTDQRTRLDDIRAGVTKKCHHCGFKYYITVNFYPSGHPAEVFIKIAKGGSTVAGFVKVLCITISVAFQYGVPWQVLYKQYSGQAFVPMDAGGQSIVGSISDTINGIVESWKHDHESGV